MSNTRAGLESEQDHYDESLDAREAHRRRFGQAPNAAASPQDARAIRKDTQRRLSQMPAPEEPAFFAHIDLEPLNGVERRYYLGAMSVQSADSRRLVINYNAPAAACYYKATPTNPMEMIGKRTYEVVAHRLTDYDDVILKELEEDLERLNHGDVLLRDLESSRDGSLRNIARTIGAAQYDVISHPLDCLLVVQGGPGTGKSAVALHRISYWLYNSRTAEDPADRVAPSDVLVVGPNQVFTRYISRVLPGLGDGDVAYQHLRNLGPQASTGRMESVELAALKGQNRMSHLLARALLNRIRIPDDALAVGPAGSQTMIEIGALRSAIDQLSGLPYRSGRDYLRTWLEESVSAAGRDYASEHVDAALERVWPLVTPRKFVQELLASTNMLLGAAGADFTAAEIQLLQRTSAGRITEETWSDADVALIDEVEWLMEGQSNAYKHVVVDEAQDLSDMQLRSLRRRSANGSMTIVGDLAQSTGPHARQDWDGVIAGLEQKHAAKQVELEFGYRVPRQVFDFASQLLPFVAPTIAVPRIIRSGPADPELKEHHSGHLADGAVAAAVTHAGRGAFVGIVCPAELRPSLVAALTMREIKWTDTEAAGAGLTSINVVSPEAAKGLEFDAVVVMEPEAIVRSDPHGLRLLYIALTRTTSHLTVVHTGQPMPLPTLSEPDIAGETHEPDQLSGEDSQNRSSGLPPTDRIERVHTPLPLDFQGSEIPGLGSASDSQASSLDLSRAVVRAAASRIAMEIRSAVPETQWPRLLEQLREELDVGN